MREKIDIIIPTYKDSEVLLERCFESIKKQTIKDLLKITILEDNGGEDYVAILQKIVNKYSNTLDIDLYLHSENIGPGGRRQEGIEKTSNKYIYLIDSDDWIPEEDSLEALLEVFEKHPITDVAFGLNYISSNDDFMKPNLEDFVKQGASLSYGYTDLMTTVSHQGKLYKRKFIEENKLNFYNGSYYNEELSFNLKTIFLAKKFFIKKPTYFRYFNTESMTFIPAEQNFYHNYLNLNQAYYNVLNFSDAYNNGYIDFNEFIVYMDSNLKDIDLNYNRIRMDCNYENSDLICAFYCYIIYKLYLEIMDENLLADKFFNYGILSKNITHYRNNQKYYYKNNKKFTYKEIYDIMKEEEEKCVNTLGNKKNVFKDCPWHCKEEKVKKILEEMLSDENQ